VSTDSLLDIWRLALTTAVEVGAPFVAAALGVGLLASLLMAATQLQEGALSFVPKVAALVAVLTLMGPWLLGRLTRLTEATADKIVEVGRGVHR
jgi:flagellar biosynthesis protein FliQ